MSSCPSSGAAAAPPVTQVAPDWAIPAGWDDPVTAEPHLAGRQLFGGDLDGVIDRLDHIASLGADTLTAAAGNMA